MENYRKSAPSQNTGQKIHDRMWIVNSSKFDTDRFTILDTAIFAMNLINYTGK